MSDYSSCLEILTKLIGFQETNNSEKITLADDVEIDTLMTLKNWLIQLKGVDNVSKENYNIGESFWSCKYCTYHNPMDVETCQICALPANVCYLNHLMISMHMLEKLNQMCDIKDKNSPSGWYFR